MFRLLANFPDLLEGFIRIDPRTVSDAFAYFCGRSEGFTKPPGHFTHVLIFLSHHHCLCLTDLIKQRHLNQEDKEEDEPLVLLALIAYTCVYASTEAGLMWGS